MTRNRTTAIKNNYPKGANHALKRAEQLLPPRQHPPGTDPILIIDGMNVAYQALYAYSKLSYNGKSTAVLFGFPQILKGILQMYNPTRVIICWDGERHPKRIEACPGYKSHRASNMTPRAKRRFLNQVKMLRKLLNRMGIAQAYNPKIEGDDMIYWVTKRMQMFARVIIVSADKDFKQLINWDVSVFNPRTKYIEGVFAFSAGNYGLEVSQYVDFLSLTGDSSDDIPGIRGIGEARAASFLQKYWSIKRYLDDKRAEFTGMVDKDKVNRVRKTNRLMIDLAYFNEKFNKDVNILYYRKTANPKFNEEKYLAICRRYAMNSMLSPTFIDQFKRLSDG